MTEQFRKGKAHLQMVVNQAIDSANLRKKIQENANEYKALADRRKEAKRLMEDMMCLLEQVQAA